jgi:hypothetical protein
MFQYNASLYLGAIIVKHVWAWCMPQQWAGAGLPHPVFIRCINCRNGVSYLTKTAMRQYAPVRGLSCCHTDRSASEHNSAQCMKTAPQLVSSLDHGTMVLQQLHCLPVLYWVKFNDCCLIYCTVNRRIAQPVIDRLTWIALIPSYQRLRMDAAGKYMVLKARTLQECQSFSYAFPASWNDLSWAVKMWPWIIILRRH